ncbi:shikimate kinase [bacterium]|nr:shikimate kinase [bacterium]MBP9807906.1 shikimate kinase [bacterium]
MGPSGAGKSSTAKLLSEKLSRPCLDCDTTIEERAGQSIATLFKEQGEPAFRAMENQLLDELLAQENSNQVIACGGGLPMGDGNMDKLKILGQTIYLTAQVETLAKRIGSQGSRPLLAGNQAEQLTDKIRKLLTRRKKIYEQAHLTIDTEAKTVAEVVAEIQRILTNTTL